MALTKKQLDELLAIIDRHMLTFMVDTLGPQTLDAEELERMKSLGLLKENVKHMVVDATEYGRLVAILPEDVRKKLSPSDIEKLVKKLRPMTSVEKRAIEYATTNVGEHIRGLRDAMLKDTKTAVAGQALKAVRESVVSAVADRKTVKELKTILFDRFDDRNRDWQRVASTEMNDAIQFGIAAEIKKTSDDDEEQRVFKRPNPDACKHCLRLFLQPDGTPKIFKLNELAYSNVGKKAADWVPTIGVVHPWCSCQLHVIPEGFGFKKRYTVSEKFSVGDKTYKVGEQVDESERAKLSGKDKNKLRQEAILEFTGE